MKLNKAIKKALDKAAEEIAKLQKEGCEEIWPHVQPDIIEDYPQYSFDSYVTDDWADNGYECLDNVTMYLDKKVQKLLD